MQPHLAWAKTAPDGSFGMSVLQHTRDIVGIVPLAMQLLPRRVWADVERTTGVEPTKLMQLAAAGHDCGKLSPLFVEKAPHLLPNPLGHAGAPASRTSAADRAGCHHSIISGVTMVDWLARVASDQTTPPASDPTSLPSQAASPSRNKQERASKRGWFAVLAGHHGTFPMDRSIARDTRNVLRRLETPEWQGARFALLDQMSAEIGLSSEDLRALARISWTAPLVATVTGTLIVADWWASSPTHFPYTGGAEEDIDQETRLADATCAIHLGGRWAPQRVGTGTFAQRFGLPAGATPRPMQQAALDAVADVLRTATPGTDGDASTNGDASAGGLYILEEQTGGGKTEAALAMAEMIAHATGADGLFFAQPTRVTSNAAFDRIKHWLELGRQSQSQPGQNPPAPISTILAHGKAELHAEYGQMLQAALPREIYDGSEGEDRPPIAAPGSVSASTSDPAPPTVEATQWFRGPKTSLLASVVVGTIDQLLFAALRSRHQVMRHVGLQGKVVIVDEVHAADHYMRIYLRRALTWCGAYGIPVITLSATLPPQQRRELLEAYHQGAAIREAGADARRVTALATEPASTLGLEIPDVQAYPRLTTYSAGAVHVHPAAQEAEPVSVRVEFADGDEPDIARMLLDATADGGCVAAVCNTVSRAQQVYRELRSQLAAAGSPGGAQLPAAGDPDGVQLPGAPEPQIVLLHSRFVGPVRQQREQELVDRLGRDASARPQRCIVVSTQIIEQGLDLDFDLIVSDIAPVDLLIQRAGRLHRHPLPRHTRPRAVREPRLVVVGAGVPQMDGPPPEFPVGIRKVYGHLALLQSTLTLARHLAGQPDPLLTRPVDIPALVTAAYAEDPDMSDVPETWRSAWAAAREDAEDKLRGQEGRAQACLLPMPTMDGLRAWNDRATIAAEGAARSGVRDAEEGLEVLPLVRRDGRLYAVDGVPGLSAASGDADTGPGTPALQGRPVDAELPEPLARQLSACTVRLPSWVLGASAAQEGEDADGGSGATAQLIGQLREHVPAAWATSAWLRGAIPLVMEPVAASAAEAAELSAADAPESAGPDHTQGWAATARVGTVQLEYTEELGLTVGWSR